MPLPATLSMGPTTVLWLALHGLTIVFYACFAVFVYRRRPPSPMWPVLFWLQITALLWAAGDIAAILAPDAVTKSAALLVLYSGSIPIAALWWLLAVRFAEANGVAFSWGRQRWVHWPVYGAGALWLLFATNGWHGQFVTVVVGARQEHHWLWYGTAAFNQTLGIAAAGLYFSIARRTDIPQRLRDQADLMLAAAIAMPMANFVDSMLPQIWPVDLSIATGSVIGAIYLYGIYRSNLFDLSPFTLEQIVRDDPTGVLIADRNFRLRFANEAAQELLPGIPLEPGLALPEALSTHIEPYRDPETPISWKEHWRSGIDSGPGRLYRFESDGPGTAGQQAWLWITARPMPPSIAARGFHCLRIQDVTGLAEMTRQRRELTERLERAERLESLGVLAGGIAHELADPLRAVRDDVKIAIDLSSTPDADRGEVRRTLERLADSARRGSDMADHMLRFAQEGERGVSDLNRLVEAGCHRAAVELARAGVSIALDLPPEKIPVRCHRGDIEQMTVDLLRQLIPGCDRGESIRVATGRGEKEAWLRVERGGRDIDGLVGSGLFGGAGSTAPFALDPGRDMAVIQGIAASLGGRIEQVDEGGLGQAFEVRLPLVELQPRTIDPPFPERTHAH